MNVYVCTHACAFFCVDMLVKCWMFIFLMVVALVVQSVNFPSVVDAKLHSSWNPVSTFGTVQPDNDPVVCNISRSIHLGMVINEARTETHCEINLKV